jgi:hypothetical protein
MPWTRRQVKYLLSSGSPLSGTQKDKMKTELHADPAMGHKKKGSAALSEEAKRRATMRSDMAKFTGKSSEASFRRPKRKVLNRYA